MDGYEYGLAGMVLSSAVLRQIARRQIAKRGERVVTTSAVDPADVPPAGVESRQVRRARERAEVKGQVRVERQIEALQPPQPKARKPVSVEPDPTSHPARYPVHADTAKGQRFGGECNRTACANTGAVWWNMGTYGLYCRECANGINWQKDKSPLCVYVDAKPDLADMEQFKKDHDYYGAF